MGKSKKGKKGDTEKRAALVARKEAKANKSEHKRLAKQTRHGDPPDIAAAASNHTNEQQLQDLLQQYRQRDDEQITAPHLEPLPDGVLFPPARANATLTLVPETNKKKQPCLYLFGGEYYNGVENIVLNQLFQFDLTKREWKRVVTPVSPPPRCSHSTVYYNQCLYVLAGEMATADSYHHYKDLWKYDIQQQIWTELSSSKAVMRSNSGTAPSARSGHVAAVWKHWMIVFGGFLETASAVAPRWYNDVTVFDLHTEQWMDIPYSKFATQPEPRSACNVAILQDSVMLVHGGFSKLLHKTSSGSSSSLAATTTATIRSEQKVHTDSWILHLKPLESGKPPVWERWTSSLPRSQLPGSVMAGSSNHNNAASIILKHPGGRSGTSSVTYQDRLLVFGGVVDTEQHHHKVDSVFYNDLFGFDMERRKWFPIHVHNNHNQESNHTTSTGGGGCAPRPKRDNDDDAPNDNHADDADDTTSGELQDYLDDEDDAAHLEEHRGWNVEKLRSNMFAFMDGNGNLVYEKIIVNTQDEGPSAMTNKESEQDEEKEEEKEEGKEEENDHAAQKTNRPSQTTSEPPGTHFQKIVTSSSVMTLNPETHVPEPVMPTTPLPRIKACLVVSGHVLYVYGGLLEVGDREVTLDDLWSLDLRKRSAWHCLWPGTMHHQVWKGAIHDDDDSYVSAGVSTADVDDDEDGDGDDDDEESWSGNDPDNDETKSDPKQEKIKESRSQRSRQEMVELNETYGLSDANRTSELHEVLADFYARTCTYWNQEAAARVADAEKDTSSHGTLLSAKELKRQGFALARERYTELEPIMERLRQLDLQKEAKKERKADKKDVSSSHR